LSPAGTTSSITSLLPDLVRREIASRFSASQSGWLWLVVTPLFLLSVYGFVFGVIFRARVPEGLEVPFVVWLAVALWPWLAFSEGVLRGSQSIVQHAALISKVAIPREVLVIASVTAVFLLHMAGYVVVLATLGVMGYELHWLAAWFVLPALATFYVFALGLALMAAAVQVFVRDLEQALPTLMMMWFFLTPILYAPEMLPAQFARLLALNPVYWWMEQVRAPLMWGDWLHPVAFVLTAFLSVVVLGLGLKLFRRLSPHFEDFL